MMDGKRVTLRDVAAASGVSRATAGFVLSDAPNMSITPATRERVLAAARDLGYVPHGIARALREGSSRIVVLNVDAYFEGNYSRSYIRGLDDELAQHGHVLLVRHGNPGSRQVLDAISPRAVLRLAGNYLEPGHEFDDGGWDGGLAGNIAVQLGYLNERGHAHVALALPDTDSPWSRVRLRFAREAAARLGIAAPTVLVMPRDRAAGLEILRAFRSAHPDVTAVAAIDDDLALRVLAAAGDLGLRVPDDLAIIGYDDTEYGALITPALTTVHIDAEDHGRRIARAILGLEPAGFLAKPAQVIVRESA